MKEVVGDLRSRESVQSAVDGCRAAFHVAALYRFWARDPEDFYAVNVEGTRNVLAAAKEAGVERLVYTSTVGTLGLEHVSGSSSADERSFPDVRHLYGSYKRSKYVAEHEVLRAIAEGLPASLVLPTFPVGPGDRRAHADRQARPRLPERSHAGLCGHRAERGPRRRRGAPGRYWLWRTAAPAAATSSVGRTSPWSSCWPSS